MRHAIRALALALAITAAAPVAVGAEEPPVEEAAVDVWSDPGFVALIDTIWEWLAYQAGPEATLRSAADEFGVDPELLVAIARCESGLDPGAANPASDARGLLQHRERFYPRRALAVGTPSERIDPLLPRQNARAGAWLLATQGTRPWAASRDCWS